MRTTTFPHFWTDRHDREYQRILRMKSLYEGKHCIVLHDREGGWKLPIYVTHNWLGDRLTRTLTALVWREFPYVAAGEKARQGELLRMLRDTGDARADGEYAGCGELCRVCLALPGMVAAAAAPGAAALGGKRRGVCLVGVGRAHAVGGDLLQGRDARQLAGPAECAREGGRAVRAGPARMAG